MAELAEAGNDRTVAAQAGASLAEAKRIAALATELADLEIDSPFTESGKITMRGDDHTMIRYPIAWGRSVSEPRGFTDWVSGDWDEIIKLEAEWKVRQGYA